MPVNAPRYDDYGLRKRVRDDVAQRSERRRKGPPIRSKYWGGKKVFQNFPERPQVNEVENYMGQGLAKGSAPRYRRHLQPGGT